MWSNCKFVPHLYHNYGIKYGEKASKTMNVSEMLMICILGLIH